MSGRPARVHGRTSFGQLVRSTRRARSGPVTVHFLPGIEPDRDVRVAYAVGRHVGSAVVRNTWRRRLRVIAAEASPTLPPGSYLVGVRADVTALRFDELRERVVNAMHRASEVRR